MLLDPDGNAVAYGWRDEPDYWLDVPGVALLGFRPGGGEIVARPQAPEADVEDAYRNLALPLALHVSGYEVLHASGVRTTAGVVGFCGLSGTGKTTTAFALSRRGHPLWSDDAVVLEPHGGRVFAHPLPFRGNLRPQTREALGLAEEVAPQGEAGDPEPLAALVILERVAGADAAGVERLGAKAALPALLPHSFRFDLTALESRRDTVRRYLAVVAAVPVLRARFVPSFATLDDLLDRLEAALAAL